MFNRTCVSSAQVFHFFFFKIKFNGEGSRSKSHMNNVRDTNYFIKFFYKILILLMIIGKWKSDFNGGFRWKLIRG